MRYYVFVKSSFKHIREECESKRAYVFLLCFIASWTSKMVSVMLYVLCCPVNGTVCFVCCVFDGVWELFGETIRNVFGCSCYFVVECYGCVWWCSVG